jgi:hypothetical protein
METILSLVFTLGLSFTISTFTFYFVLSGFAGNYLKNWLSNKIAKNDFVWFNKLLIYGGIFYLFVIFTANYHMIHLDNIYEVEIDNVKASIPAETAKLLISDWGSTAAFIGGARIGALLVNKYPISIVSKIATSLVTGTLTSFTCKMTNVVMGKVGNVVTGGMNGNIESNPLTDNSLSFVAKKVKASMHTQRFANEINNSIPRLPNKSLFENGREWLRNNSMENLNSVSDQVENTGNVMVDNNVTSTILNTIDKNQLTKDFHDLNKILVDNVGGKPNLIENVDGVTKTNLIENVDGINSSSSSIADFFINSPLESTASEILNATLKADLTTVLSDNLFVNIGIVYLLCVLAFAFTVRFVVDHDFILNKVKALNPPFGKVLHYILSKILSVWKNASVLWIYFILFFVICFCCASSYVIYGCLYLISMSS